MLPGGVDSSDDIEKQINGDDDSKCNDVKAKSKDAAAGLSPFLAGLFRGSAMLFSKMA